VIPPLRQGARVNKENDLASGVLLRNNQKTQKRRTGEQEEGHL
jgi:hypothetical protein